jgi:hypothetical protein
VRLERGPHSLVRIIEELLERKAAASVYKTEINDRGDSLRCPRDTLYPLKLALTSPTCGGRSVGIVRWRTKTPEFYTCMRSVCINRTPTILIRGLSLYSSAVSGKCRDNPFMEVTTSFHIHLHPTIRHHIIRVTDSVVK